MVFPRAVRHTPPFCRWRREPRASTSRVIADALRTAIVEGTLAPGAPLRQDAIARHFSVSAIPVREALRQLESEGWAKAAVHKGATVAPLSADEAREIYEIRSALESLAIGLAIPLHTPGYAARRGETVSRGRSRTGPVAVRRPQRGLPYEPVCAGWAAATGGDDRHAASARRALSAAQIRPARCTRTSRIENTRRCSMPCVAAISPAARSLVAAHLLGTGDLLYRFLIERAQAEAAQAKQRKPRAKRAAHYFGS